MNWGSLKTLKCLYTILERLETPPSILIVLKVILFWVVTPHLSSPRRRGSSKNNAFRRNAAFFNFILMEMSFFIEKSKRYLDPRLRGDDNWGVTPFLREVSFSEKRLLFLSPSSELLLSSGVPLSAAGRLSWLR